MTKKSTGTSWSLATGANLTLPNSAKAEKAKGKTSQLNIFLFYQLLRILKVESRKQIIEKLFLFCALKLKIILTPDAKKTHIHSFHVFSPQDCLPIKFIQ